MAFSQRQSRALKAKLAHRHVKSRVSNGMQIAYVEGWHVIAEANRIFGFDAWDRTTLAPTCVWTEMQRGQTVCFYSTRVRIRVRAGDIVIMRDGIGTGIGRSASAEQAHEIALKAAETDATKRALATFGNPFGLALYDKEQAGVTKPMLRPNSRPNAGDDTFLLNIPGRATTRHPTASAFVAAALEAIPKLASLDALYAFWEVNVASLAQLRIRSESHERNPAESIIASLKRQAQALTTRQGVQSGTPNALAAPASAAEPREARLAIPKERRIRDKAHLLFVTRHPCAVCGREPVHAHHLRFAQPRAMAMKVSDEFTVPLCAIHHDELHRSGDERAWWARHGIIEPLKIAAKLWEASQRDERKALPEPAAPTQADTEGPHRQPATGHTASRVGEDRSSNAAE